MTISRKRLAAGLFSLCLALPATARSQSAIDRPPAVSPVASPSAPIATTPAAAAAIPPGYLIGPDDVLQVVFWRDKDLSAEVVVRPDGRISLPLLNEVVAAGITPEQLRTALVERAKEYIAEPNATVLVKEIRSRRVFITGNVEKPGPFPLTGPTTVLQLIALAGGLKEYADQKNIVIMRTVNGQQSSYPFDYHQVSRGTKLAQNLELKPGDTVVVR